MSVGVGKSSRNRRQACMRKQAGSNLEQVEGLESRVEGDCRLNRSAFASAWDGGDRASQPLR